MGKIIGITGVLLKKNLTCKKVGLLILFLTFIIFPYALPAVRTAQAHSWKLSPYLFAFICNDSFVYMLIICGSFWLFSEPFYSANSLGKPNDIITVLGSILYIFIITLIYIFMVYFICFIVILPVISIEFDWGLGWKMLAFSKVNDYPSLLQLNSQIIKTYSPINAVILSALLLGALLFILGLIFCLFDIIKPNSSPAFFIVAIIVADTSLYNMYLSDLIRFSPMSLSMLSSYNEETAKYGVSLQYGCRFLLVSIFALILLCLFLTRQARIQKTSIVE